MSSEATIAIARDATASSPGRVSRFARQLRRKPLGLLAIGLLIILCIIGFGAPIIAPYGEAESRLADSYMGPGTAHWLGADQVGRDVMSRVFYGVRLALIVAVATGLVSTVLFVTLGVLGGYFQGWLDLVLQRLVDAQMALPNIVVLMALSLIAGQGVLPIVFVLALTSAFIYSRIIRSTVVLIREMPYIDAARATGAHDIRIILRHVLPNIAAPAIVLGTLVAGFSILAEATLSFLGFGIPPPAPSLGLMIRQTDLIYTAPWAVVAPGIALSLIIFTIFILGDTMRDLLDPRLRGLTRR